MTTWTENWIEANSVIVASLIRETFHPTHKQTYQINVVLNWIEELKRQVPTP